MKQGRHICNTLKDIRRKIADANNIVYEPRECHHEGECAGSCPACEAEVRYIESELKKRSSMGKKVAVAGIAVGMMGLAACTTYNVEEDVLQQQVINSAKTNADGQFMGVIVEQMPAFPGGNDALMEYLKNNISCPQRCDSVEGRVVTSFFVERDGSITEAQVVKSLAPAYDEEVLRVVKAMPKWVPGRRNGEATRIKYTLPVIFRIDR